MARNNTVYLLVGQRGSGKSEYAQRLIGNRSGISLVSRDEILIRLFGSTHTNPYTGGQYIAESVMNRLLRFKLSTQTGLRLILDAWTGDSRERKLLIGKLKQYGATHIVALYFITPLDRVSVWFWQKPGIAKAEEIGKRQEKGLVFFSEDAPANDYELFHEFASQIDSDGFDEVVRINPEEELISLA